MNRREFLLVSGVGSSNILDFNGSWVTLEDDDEKTFRSNIEKFELIGDNILTITFPNNAIKKFSKDNKKICETHLHGQKIYLHLKNWYITAFEDNKRLVLRKNK